MEEEYLLLVAAVSVGIIGLFGNAMVFGVQHSIKNKSCTDMFVMAMGACDFLSCLVICPLVIVMSAHVLDDVQSSVELCKLETAMSSSSSFGTGLFLTAIALDRYRKTSCVSRPLLNKFRSKWFCIFVALLSFAFGLISYFSTRCSEGKPMNYAKSLYQASFSFVSEVALCLFVATMIGIISFCYVKLTLQIKRRKCDKVRKRKDFLTRLRLGQKRNKVSAGVSKAMNCATEMKENNILSVDSSMPSNIKISEKCLSTIDEAPEAKSGTKPVNIPQENDTIAGSITRVAASRFKKFSDQDTTISGPINVGPNYKRQIPPIDCRRVSNSEAPTSSKSLTPGKDKRSPAFVRFFSEMDFFVSQRVFSFDQQRVESARIDKGINGKENTNTTNSGVSPACERMSFSNENDMVIKNILVSTRRINNVSLIMLLVTLIFLVSWVLHWISHVFDETVATVTVLVSVTNCLFLVNYISKPILYTVMSATFRVKVKDFLLKQCREL